MNITYQDYLSNPTEQFIWDCITKYKASDYYEMAVSGYNYFNGNNEGIMNLEPLRVSIAQNYVELNFAKIPSNIFKRLILQVCNYQLGNGVIVDGKPIDDILGTETDRKILQCGINAMMTGVSYAFVNQKRIVKTFNALNMFTLDDEFTGEPKMAIRFWKVETYNGDKDYFQVFSEENIKDYEVKGNVAILINEQNYVTIIKKDALGIKKEEAVKPSRLPIIPFYANQNEDSELTYNIKSKIDVLDEIVSRNAAFVNKTSMIFWLINSTGIGDPEQIGQMIVELEKLGIAVNEADGLSAEPKVLDPNVAPRLQTKEDIESDIYKDFMALNLDSLVQGNITATAINASSSMLKMKASDLYYYASTFIKQVLQLSGIEFNAIVMKENSLTNVLEQVQAIYMARQDLSQRKALELNPLIENDEIEDILKESDVEKLTGMPTAEELQKKIDESMIEE